MGAPPELLCPEGYGAIALRTPTIPPAEHTACYVIGHEDAIIVDPGSPFDGEIEKLLDTLLYPLRGSGGTARGVFLTHHHPDHIGGALVVARTLDVPILAHPETLCRVALDGHASEALGDGATLHVDKTRELRAVFTPGHAPGHLCLFEPSSRVLVGGDMVPGIGTTMISPPEGNMSEYIAGLERLAALDPDWLLSTLR